MFGAAGDMRCGYSVLVDLEDDDVVEEGGVSAQDSPPVVHAATQTGSVHYHAVS